MFPKNKFTITRVNNTEPLHVSRELSGCNPFGGQPIEYKD